MSISIEFPGVHPVAFTAITLQGYHSPLSGEAANMTLSLDHGLLWPSWLQAPPLGSACDVIYDGTVILEGSLAGVRVAADSVNFKVEG